MKVLFVMIICVMLTGCGDGSHTNDDIPVMETKPQIDPTAFTHYSSLLNNVNRSFLIVKGGIQPTERDIQMLDIDHKDGVINDTDYLEWLRLYEATL